MPIIENGIKYIFVVSDYFSKWTEAFQMPYMEAATVAKIFVEVVAATFGVQNETYPDRGRQYESKLISDMYRLLHVHNIATPYHPKSVDMVERFKGRVTRRN